ncbi:MAG: glycoside hydrolase family 28 protein [Sedimentisphaerales bacterium]|nr:glycoside hydrolase family 28 protein [Sedimentisphaerales bacterium]
MITGYINKPGITNRRQIGFYILILLSIVSLIGTAAAQTQDKVFDVRQYGAKGDGTTLDTEAIQKALDECGKSGGGIVRFPSGTYLSKPITLQNKTTLQLDEGATLQATDNHADFMKTPGDWLSATSGSDFVPFIGGKDLTDISITGKGTIDGCGKVWWGPAEEARRKKSGYTLPRPNMIILTRCKNVKISGVTIRNSPKFHLVPTDCEDVVIESVTFMAPEEAPNTDAIDPSRCRNVLITKCHIDVGDDNVAIKSGRKVDGREFACENITVSDCVIRHGHGISIGSETVGGVHGLTVQRCTFEDTDNGIRIKSYRGRGGLVENITYSDITMKNVTVPISISGYYPKIPAENEAQPVTPETPVYRNIRITNLKVSSPRSAGFIVGLPESLISDVVLENVQISASTGLTIRNAKNVKINHVKIEAEDGKQFILENATVEGLDKTEK